MCKFQTKFVGKNIKIMIGTTEKNIKPRPNHRAHLATLSRMAPAERLTKAFELNLLGRQLFLSGLHQRFPEKTAAEIHVLFLKRLEKCYNKNY